MRILRMLMMGAVVVAAAEGPVTGKWEVHTSAAGHESKYACTFTQNGVELSGTCSPAAGTVQITGKVEDKNVTWTYKSEYNGSPLTVVFKGKVESPEKMAGMVTAVEYGVDGDFTATAAK